MSKDNPDRDLEAAAARATVLVEWTAQLRRDVAESLEGTVLRGARPVQVGNGIPGGTARPLTSPGTLTGLCLKNISANPGSVHLFDAGADDDDGLLIAAYRLPADEHVAEWFGPGGISLSRGLLVVPDTVTVDEFMGSVYIRGSE